MKKIKSFLVLTFVFLSTKSSADLLGADLPLLTEIVSNTLNTLHQLEVQNGMLHDELRGINDRIERIKTINDLLRPEDWHEWKDPREATRRLQQIFYTLPPEYRTEKSEEMEQEISRAMSLSGQLAESAGSTFNSGKELERRSSDSSPGVAQKLAASGVGSLVVLEAQNQVAQATVISLLSQMIADGSSKDAYRVVSQGKSFSSFSLNLSTSGEDRFSKKIVLPRVQQ